MIPLINILLKDYIKIIKQADLMNLINGFFIHFKFEYFEIFSVILFYLIPIWILITHQITYGKSNALVIMNEIIYSICLLEYLYPLDMGLDFCNYITYKNIILILIFLFTILSISFICFSLYYRMHHSYLKILVNNNIIHPGSFYIIVIFSYISLMIVAFKLIPQDIPINEDSEFYGTLSIIPLLVVQGSFVISLLKINNIIQFKIKQCLTNYDVSNSRYLLFNLIKRKDYTIKALLYFIIMHIHL